MSADNMIYVRQIDDSWYVWMGFASNDEEPMPASRDRKFPNHNEAIAYAQGWLHGEMIVEYGIVELEGINVKCCVACGRPFLKSDKEIVIGRGVFA